MQNFMYWFGLLASLLAANVQAELIGNKINFQGKVVKKTCELEAGSAQQLIPMPEVRLSSLYATGLGPKQPFEIKLLNCELTLVKSVAVVFSGDEDAELPGRLKVTGLPDVAIAISVADADEVLPLGKRTSKQGLTIDENLLKFNAQLEAHPSALAVRNIMPGAYRAVTNFTLEYY